MTKFLLYFLVPICISSVYYFSFLWNFMYLSILSVCLLTCVFVLTLCGHLSLSSPHQTSTLLLDNIEKEARQLETAIRVCILKFYRFHIIELKKLCKYNFILQDDQNNWVYVTKKPHLPVIFGRTVDSQLQLLIDYFIRDFVTQWLKELSHKPEPVIDKFKEHIWTAVQNLYDRLLKVDAEKLLANDMVTKITQHFERIRIARSCA